MSPETGKMSQATMLEEAEVIKQRALERQALLNERMSQVREELFGDLREEYGYSDFEPTDRSALTDVRVESVNDALEAVNLKYVLRPSKTSVDSVLKGRKAAGDIISGEDSKLLVIVGPCSIHDPEQALEYADWLVGMRQEHSEDLEIVMRTYLEKPRTGLDWKGLVNDPNLDNSTDINLGLALGRLLLCQITNKTVPTALERIDSRTTQYFDDLSVYDAIGARDSETTRARVYLSVTSAVAGLKNPTDGNILKAVQGVLTARGRHTYLGDNDHGALAEMGSRGNETAHPVLRGGADGPNYSSEHIQETKRLLRENDLPEAIVVDASHGNSGKVAARQFEVVMDLGEQIARGESAIRGVMIESNLREGKQRLAPRSELKYGISVTDECAGLPMTESMLDQLALSVRKRRQALQLA